MMLKYLALLLIGGCSFFVSKIDSPLVDEKSYFKNIPEVPTYCPMKDPATFQLVGTNHQSQAAYYDFQNQKNYDFLDQFALWSLLQLNIRPDQSSLTSRFQVLLLIKGQSHYLDFFSETTDNQYPMLFGLEWILKKFNKNSSLEKYAAILDSQFHHRMSVGKNFENFLNSNKDKIKLNPVMSPYFIRGTEILKENEKMPKLNYGQVVKFYRSHQSKQKIIVNTSLNNFTTPSGKTGSCNYDFNLYDNSIFLIDKMIPVANLYGLAKNENAFLASSSQKITDIQPINGFPIFLGESKVRSSAVCVIQKDQDLIWTFSNLSRDPGQHLFHLIRYGLADTKSTLEVDRLIRHSRHLFLSDPVRLVIESSRSRPDQIENLLKLNLPIYNAEILGNIWAFTLFNKSSRFVIDDRNMGSYLCK